jgi:type II secretory pathway pseudopilin PulG
MEVVVVIVILAIAAGVVLPRALSDPGRTVKARAFAVAELLSALARRDAMLSQPLSLVRDAERGVLFGEVLSRGGGATQPRWQRDLLLPEADLAGATLVSVRADGAELDPDGLRIDMDQYQPRRALLFVLADERGQNPWSVELSASALQATVRSGDARNDAARSEADVEDLDATGREKTAW